MAEPQQWVQQRVRSYFKTIDMVYSILNILKLEHLPFPYRGVPAFLLSQLIGAVQQLNLFEFLFTKGQ